MIQIISIALKDYDYSKPENIREVIKETKI